MAEKLTRYLLDETLQYIDELISTIYCTSPIYEVGMNIAENTSNCQLKAIWDINETTAIPQCNFPCAEFIHRNEHVVIFALLHSLRSHGDVTKLGKFVYCLRYIKLATSLISDTFA